MDAEAEVVLFFELAYVWQTDSRLVLLCCASLGRCEGKK